MLKKIFFFLTLIAVIIFYEDISWGNNWREQKEEEQNLREDIFPEYCFKIKMESASVLKAELKINYPNNTGRTLDNLKILLPANILYGKKYIEINSLEVLDKGFSLIKKEDNINIFLKESLMPGETAKINLHFSVFLPEQANIFGVYQGVMRLACWYPVIPPFNQEQGTWADFEKTSFGDPYYFESARYKGTIEVPEPWQLISPFTTSVKNTTGIRSYTFDSLLPARDCTFVIGDKFKKSSEKTGSVIVEYYFQKHDQCFSRTAGNILEFFSSWLGEYPYSRLVVVDLPLKGNMGMEFAGIVFLSTSGRQIGEQTLAHEIAHQYWYGLIGTDQIKEPWVDEGLVSYCSLLYLENKYGGAVYNRLIGSISPQFSYLSYLPISSYPNQEIYKEAVYTQPMLFWHKIRELGGKKQLWHVLGQVQEEYRFQVITGEELLSALKEGYGLNNYELRRMLFS